MIAEYIDPNDLKNLRRCCSVLSETTWDMFLELHFTERSIALQEDSLEHCLQWAKRSELGSKVRRLRIARVDECDEYGDRKYNCQVFFFVDGFQQLVETLTQLPNLQAITLDHCLYYHRGSKTITNQYFFPLIIYAIERSGLQLQELRSEVSFPPRSFVLPYKRFNPEPTGASRIQKLDLWLDPDGEDDNVYGDQEHFLGNQKDLRNLRLKASSDCWVTGRYTSSLIKWLAEGQIEHHLGQELPSDYKSLWCKKGMLEFTTAPSLDGLRELTLEGLRVPGRALFDVIQLSRMLEKCVLRSVCLEVSRLCYKQIARELAGWRDLLTVLALRYRKPHSIQEFIIDEVAHAVQSGNWSDRIERIWFGECPRVEYLSSEPDPGPQYKSAPDGDSSADDESSSEYETTIVTKVSTDAVPDFNFSKWLSEVSRAVRIP